jgi:hypothetical protein
LRDGPYHFEDVPWNDVGVEERKRRGKFSAADFSVGGALPHNYRATTYGRLKFEFFMYFFVFI